MARSSKTGRERGRQRRREHGPYRKVYVRMWGDADFVSLSRPKSGAQHLWIFLLTGPHTNSIPGLFCAGIPSIADAIGWRPAAVRSAWKEIESAGMARADWEARVVFLPNAVKYNRPENTNVVASWRGAIDSIPECALRDDAVAHIAAHMREDLGSAYADAWEHGARARTKIYPVTRAAVRRRDGDTCAYCERTVNWNDRRGPEGGTYDHVDPRGDATEENLVVACRSCNSSKGLRTPTQAGLRWPPAVPKSGPGSDLGRFPEKRHPQEQEQEQEQEGEEEEARVVAHPPLHPAPAQDFLDVMNREYQSRFFTPTWSVPSKRADDEARVMRLIATHDGPAVKAAFDEWLEEPRRGSSAPHLWRFCDWFDKRQKSAGGAFDPYAGDGSPA